MTWRMLDALSALAGAGMTQRVGWVLVHSLWQGALVAAALAVALRSLRNRTAAARYATSCAAMVLVAALPLVTFALVPPPRAGVEASRRATLTTERQEVATTVAIPLPEFVAPPAESISMIERVDAPAVPARWRPRLAASLPSLFPWLVGAWAAGVAVLSLWHLGGWLQVRRIRRLGTRPLGATWDATVARLCRRMRVTRPVRLFESALVQVPAVVGWLRPVILVPASALTGLSPRQLEAILAHELAHVRRHDYLVNVLQSVAETLLFYHPAVWWISGHIRLEREHCCDDVASRVCGGATLYARALAAMEELRGHAGAGGSSGAATPRFVLAADGGVRPAAGPLLRRIRRLVGKEDSDRRTRLAAWPAALIAAACPLLPLAAVAVGRASADEPTPRAPTTAAPSESTAAAPPEATDAAVTDSAVKSDPSPAEGADLAANRTELARLIDERIRVGKQLSDATNGLTRLKSLLDAGEDPPGLNDMLAHDDSYNRYRQAAAEMEADLQIKPFGAEHPQALRTRARLESLRQKLEDVRAEKANALVASLSARYQADVDASQRMLKDLKDQIGRAEIEFARADADARDRATSQKAEAGAGGAPTVEQIARVDPSMLARLKTRDDLRENLARLRLTMLKNNPTVVRVTKELRAQEHGIEEAARDFRSKWVVTDAAASGAAAPATPNAAAQPATTPAKLSRTDPQMRSLLERRNEVATQLEQDRLTFGENHPKIVKARTELALLNKQIDAVAAEVGSTPGDGGADTPGGGGANDYFVSGVPRPGAFSLGGRRVNLLQALIAGGLDVDSNRDRQVLLIRRQGGANDAEPPREVATTLTVGDLVDRRDRDLFLRPDDIILLKVAPHPVLGAEAGPTLADAPAGLWERVTEYLTTAGYKELHKFSVISAYADDAAGEAFVALRLPGEGDLPAIMLGLRHNGAAWEVERPTRNGPLSAAGIGVDKFRKEFPRARRFAEPFSVPPLKPPGASDAKRDAQEENH